MDVRRSMTAQLADEQSTFDAYRKRIRDDNNQQVQDLQEGLSKEIKSLESTSKGKKEEAEKGYRVQFSREVEAHQKELNELREQHKAEIEKEKKEFELAHEKLRTSELKRNEEYRKKQDENIARLHEKYQEAIREMEDHQKLS